MTILNSGTKIEGKEFGATLNYYKKRRHQNDVSQKTIPQTKTPNMKKT
jgi:hypothetical protein